MRQKNYLSSERIIRGITGTILLFAMFFCGCEQKTRIDSKPVQNSITEDPENQPEALSMTSEQAEKLMEQFGAKISRHRDGSLKVLKLDKCDADDSLMPWIGQQDSLVELSLVQTKITDDGVAQLKSLKNLKKLRIGSNAITDRSAAPLAELVALEDLDVSNTALGDDAMKELGKLTHLKSLNLYTTKVPDAGLDFLAPLVNLLRLNLDNCPITDNAIAKLKPFRKLEWLHLGRTPITDTGLQQLIEIQKSQETRLKELHITRTQITPEAATQFKTTFPDCIVHDTVPE